MVLNNLSQFTRPALRRLLRPSFRNVVTWAEQDHWEDPRGPLGVDRPSPKLAALTPESPQWLHDLHHNGVSAQFPLTDARSEYADQLNSGLW